MLLLAKLCFASLVFIARREGYLRAPVVAALTLAGDSNHSEAQRHKIETMHGESYAA
jgi:hypothetical protein